MRELKAIVYDAVARHTAGELTARSFGAQKVEQATVAAEQSSNKPAEDSIDLVFGHFSTLHDVEEYMIDEALRRASGNFSIAAAMLGITRQTISNRIESRRVSVRDKSQESPELSNLFAL